MPRLIKPRAVRRGGTLAVAAPAFCVDEVRLAAVRAQLEGAGFRVRVDPGVGARAGYLAGDDARRAAEWMAWIDDPEVDAVICARGGYGSQRIVPRLDAARVRAARKPLLGYSDATTLLLWQRRVAGLAGFHAPMLERAEPLDDAEIDALVRALAGEPLAPMTGHPIARGRGEGRLVGGSLTLLAASLGTPWEVDTRGAIVLIEEIGEKPYSLDRLLHQLLAAGKLRDAAGLGLGHFVGCTDPKRDEPSADVVLREILEPLRIPLVRGLPFGHARPNLTWPVGARAALDGARGTLEVLEAGVVG